MNVDLEFLSELSGKRPEMDAHEILKGLWLGSYSAAESPLPVLKRFNITHILTIEQTCEPVYPNDITYKVIKEDDVPLTNLIQYFDECFHFIDNAIQSGGSILVHCMAGISRSTTIVCSYIMKKMEFSHREALSHTKQIRRIISPNKGFIKQLELYEKLNKRLPTVDEAMNRKEEKYVLELLQFYHNIYLYDKIDTFRAEMEGDIENEEMIIRETEYSKILDVHDIKCKNCNGKLLSSSNVYFHSIMPDGNPWWRMNFKKEIISDSKCNYFTIEPTDWVKPQLDGNRSDGDISCPHCRTEVGRYSWTGSNCSCGHYVYPCFSIEREKCEYSLPYHFS